MITAMTCSIELLMQVCSARMECFWVKVPCSQGQIQPTAKRYEEHRAQKGRLNARRSAPTSEVHVPNTMAFFFT